ncbi:MAG: hypothetical protein WC208_10045 [Gallionella sp.]|jgi:hypothetical protein
MSKKTTLSALGFALFFSAGNALAADQVAAQGREQVQQTTGRQLMTDEERNEQRAKMRSATSSEEREKVRAEHHEKMKQRAKEQGATIPDKPPVRGSGMGGGQGGGMGGGMGGAMGSGR